MKEQRVVLGGQHQGRTVQVVGIFPPWSSTSADLVYQRLTNSIQLVRKTNSWGGLSPSFSTFHMGGIPWRNTPGYLLPLPTLPRKKRFVTLSLWVAHSLPPHVPFWDIFAFRGNTVSAVSHVVQLVGQTLPQAGEPNV